MVKMRCKCCNGDDHILLFEGKDRLHRMAGKFTLNTCTNCGVVAVYPQLTNSEIEKYYPDDYISYPPPITNEKNWLRKKDRQYGVAKRRKIIEKYTHRKQGRILDVGCATGIFLNEMRTHGWDAYGIEPSGFASEIAVNQLGLNVFNGYLDEASFGDHFFDVITLWDVFEHLQEPVETLKTIKRILKPDGSLVITMPNTNSWERKIFKRFWAGWDVPRHYHIFSPKSIETLLNIHGLHIEHLLSFTGMLGAIRISLDFWLQDTNLPAESKRVIRKIYYSPIARLVLYPYMLLSTLMTKSTSMTIFALNKPPLGD